MIVSEVSALGTMQFAAIVHIAELGLDLPKQKQRLGEHSSHLLITHIRAVSHGSGRD